MSAEPDGADGERPAARTTDAVTTLAAMPFPDDAEDDVGFVPPLPPDDRLWRHPSERPVPRAATASPLPRRRRSSALLAFGVVLVAIAGLATIASLRHDARRFAASDDWLPAADIPPALADGVAASIVRVTAERPGGTVVTTGVLLRDDGHLVTAADPIADATAITVRVADGSVYNATIVGTDPADDLAVLDIPAGRSTAIRPASMAASSPITTGDRVFVIGRTGDGARPWIVATTIDAVQQRLVTSDGSVLLGMLRTNLPALPASTTSFSGVVCSDDGHILGLMTARTSRTSGSTSTTALMSSRSIAYATPSTWIERVSSDIIDSGSFHRSWIGVVAEDAPDGALVRSVVDRGPADRAGVAPGDVITRVGDTPVESADHLAVLVRSHHPGERISMVRARSDTVDRVEIVVSEQT